MVSRNEDPVGTDQNITKKKNSFMQDARYVVYSLYEKCNSTGALLYKPEGRGFDSRWCHWNFSFT
jgi:hypothetical protein